MTIRALACEQRFGGGIDVAIEIEFAHCGIIG
jgi:hypothetical protein